MNQMTKKHSDIIWIFQEETSSEIEQMSTKKWCLKKRYWIYLNLYSFFQVSCASQKACGEPSLGTSGVVILKRSCRSSVDRCLIWKEAQGLVKVTLLDHCTNSGDDEICTFLGPGSKVRNGFPNGPSASLRRSLIAGYGSSGFPAAEISIYKRSLTPTNHVVKLLYK